MTIDKARNRLENYYDTFCGYSDDGLCGAIYTAINTIRKYQEIQEIVKQKDYDRFNSHNYYGDFLRIQDIRRVLENGNEK